MKNDVHIFVRCKRFFENQKVWLLGSVLFSFLLLPQILLAQTGGAAGSFSRIGFGPRGMAMGNALSAVIDVGVYSYYNPALAASTVRGQQFDISTSLMSFDRNLHKANATFTLPPNAGMSFSVINASVSGIDGRTRSGYHTEMLSTNEFQFATSFGIRVNPRIYIGIGIKYFLADYHEALENTPSFGFGLGALYRVTDKLTMGATVQDLLAGYTWNSGIFYDDDSNTRTKDQFPIRYRFGASYKLTDKLLLALEPGMLRLPGSANSNADSIFQLRTGARYLLHERITVRAGWQIKDLQSVRTSNNFSAGFSVLLPLDLLSSSIDYAFVPEPTGISTMHVFGIKINL